MFSPLKSFFVLGVPMPPDINQRRGAGFGRKTTAHGSPRTARFALDYGDSLEG